MNHTAYHYTSGSLWCFIQEAGQLNPTSSVSHLRDTLLPEWSHNPHWYAFLDSPEPREWVENNRRYDYVWERVLKHVHHGDFQIMLLSWSILPEDKIRVVDWVHMEKARNEVNDVLYVPSTRKLPKIEPALRHYIRSAISLEDYMDNYALPEIIGSEPISVKRITAQEVVFRVKHNPFKAIHASSHRLL
ncbi:hypothetical protein HYZ97_04630 [Candidatus Pacearchaeota archaeon]|nr:hypothetical protein [Candidatus Pacearchaeota archaeon]